MRWNRVLNVVDCHVGGEMGRVVTGGLGDMPGTTVFEKMKYVREQRDDVRQLLLNEPRGSVTQSVNLLVAPTHPDASWGYIIMESEEYPVMSGSNTITTATVLLETGMIPMIEPITRVVLESPAGLIPLECECADGKVTSVRFVNQPAFAYHLNATLEVEGLGSLTVDVGWGGMTYLIVPASQLGFALTPDEGRDLCEMGQRLKVAGAEQLDAVHPLNSEYAGITQTQFTGPIREEDGVLTARNTVVVSPGRLDRSPCGTGSSARMAVMHAKGQLGTGDRFRHESIIGSVFDCRVESETTVGGYSAIVPSVAGQAWISGLCQIGLDPTDPFPRGYTVGDVWMSPQEALSHADTLSGRV
ncbi:hypothetical protein CIW49_14015 [Mycolicibacterium sp. P1-18]|uniref:proline racemase family protein n=1 Tax=Mycolicibacterium sp. P1-18 TaxID=2024615 RepID=UPI0011F0EF33|nr:proline racemase family protein [Mycolicibacterium sp. P1-18]KAA0098978.1 hypothetical protein CIW49_14015 [Mycolicibacterium sp. P1-18]